MTASGFFALIEKVIITVSMPYVRDRVVGWQACTELENQIVALKVR